MAVKLHWLRYFVAVAEELHFTRAAARLYVSGPALSAQIRQLEHALNVPLFVRTTRRVQLTAAGEALLAEARPALSRIDAAIDTARAVGAGRTGTLSIGYVSSLAGSLLPAASTGFRGSHPGVHLRLIQAGSAEQLSAVRAGAMDVGLHWRLGEPLPTDGLTMQVLGDERLLVALPPQHHLAASAQVSLGDLADERWLMGAGATHGYHADLVARCRVHGFEPRTVAEASGVETMIALVKAGLGLCPVPELVATARDDVALVPVRGERMSLVAIRRDTGVHAAADALVAHLGAERERAAGGAAAAPVRAGPGARSGREAGR